MSGGGDRDLLAGYRRVLGAGRPQGEEHHCRRPKAPVPEDLLSLFRSALNQASVCRRFWLEQGGGFEQATEILLACVKVFPFAGPEIRHHFIADFETFEMDDADEFIALFPNLALLKF